MSWPATKHVWKCSPGDLRASEKLVLAFIAWRVNDDKGDRRSAWVSVATMAEETRLDRKTVMSALRALERRDLISVERRAGATSVCRILGGFEPRGTSTENGTGDNQTSTENGTGSAHTSSTENGIGGVPKTGQGVYQKRDTIGKENRKTTGKGESARDVEPVAQLTPAHIDPLAWTDWADHLASIGKPISPQAARAQWRQLAGISPEKQRELIDYSIGCGYSRLFFDRAQEKSAAGQVRNNVARARAMREIDDGDDVRSVAGRIAANARRELAKREVIEGGALKVVESTRNRPIAQDLDDVTWANNVGASPF